MRIAGGRCRRRREAGAGRAIVVFFDVEEFNIAANEFGAGQLTGEKFTNRIFSTPPAPNTRMRVGPFLMARNSSAATLASESRWPHANCKVAFLASMNMAG